MPFPWFSRKQTILQEGPDGSPLKHFDTYDQNEIDYALRCIENRAMYYPIYIYNTYGSLSQEIIQEFGGCITIGLGLCSIIYINWRHIISASKRIKQMMYYYIRRFQLTLK